MEWLWCEGGVVTPSAVVSVSVSDPDDASSSHDSTTGVLVLETADPLHLADSEMSFRLDDRSATIDELGIVSLGGRVCRVTSLLAGHRRFQSTAARNFSLSCWGYTIHLSCAVIIEHC